MGRKIVIKKVKTDPEQDFHRKKKVPEVIKENNTLAILNIPKNYDESSLMKLFQEYGDIKDSRVIRDQLGNSKGYGFVEFN